MKIVQGRFGENYDPIFEICTARLKIHYPCNYEDPSYIQHQYTNERLKYFSMSFRGHNVR